MENIETNRGIIGVERLADGHLRLYGGLSHLYLGELPPTPKEAIVGQIESFLQVINDEDL